MSKTYLRLALLVLLVLFYISVFRTTDPRPSDFAAFYSGAILWENGMPAYDLPSACRVQSQVGIPLCMPFFHPPILLPILSAVSNSDYRSSFYRYAVILLLVSVLCAIVLGYLIRSWLDAVLYSSFIPLFTSILQGQDTAFILLGILIGLYLLLKDRDSYAGIAFSLTALRPHWAIFLAFGLLLARPKAFRTYLLSGVVLVVYSWLLVGTEGFRDLLDVTLLSARGIDASTNQGKMYNLVAILIRLKISAFWAWPFFIAAMIFVGLLWRKFAITLQTFSIGIVLMLFLSPHLHAHDLSLLIIPLLVWPAAVAPMLSILFVASSVFHVEQAFIYLLMAGLFVRTIYFGFESAGVGVDRNLKVRVQPHEVS
jgi:hypothetical protein